MDVIEIKKIREKLGISQEKMAHLLGVTFGTVNRWERGVFKPSHLALERLKTLDREGLK